MEPYGRVRNPKLHEDYATVRSRSESNLLGNDGAGPASPLKTEAINIGALVVETGDLPMKIRDSVAFVTGANRGIGLAFTQELLAGGARKVCAAARQPERITLGGVERVRLDVTNPEDAAAAARQCTDVNLLINNAGIALRTGFLALDSIEAAGSEMETNYYGPLLLSRAFAPVLPKHGGGAIVNLLSVLSWVAVPSAGTCSASKAAAWSLTNWLRTACESKVRG
jgi:NAD(P)-dependent dehydrogenase (short-subunit alcohol dehydrogenase family)